MPSLNVSEFRQQLLSLIDNLPNEGIVVTKRGKPVAQLLPVRKPGRGLIGALKGRLKIHGDIFSTGERWDAES